MWNNIWSNIYVYFSILPKGKLLTGTNKAWLGGFGELVNFQNTNDAKTVLANAIVSKGGTASSTMTFANLANSISNIDVGIKAGEVVLQNMGSETINIGDRCIIYNNPYDFNFSDPRGETAITERFLSGTCTRSGGTFMRTIGMKSTGEIKVFKTSYIPTIHTGQTMNAKIIACVGDILKFTDYSDNVLKIYQINDDASTTVLPNTTQTTPYTAPKLGPSNMNPPVIWDITETTTNNQISRYVHNLDNGYIIDLYKNNDSGYTTNTAMHGVKPIDNKNAQFPLFIQSFEEHIHIYRPLIIDNKLIRYIGNYAVLQNKTNVSLLPSSCTQLSYAIAKTSADPKAYFTAYVI